MADELRIERLSAAERLAVASITGTAENCTLHEGQSAAEALAAITADVEAFPADRRRLVLSHAAARYLGGEHRYETDCVTLLKRAGADLDLALDIAIVRTGLPNSNIGNAARRARLLAIRGGGSTPSGTPSASRSEGRAAPEARR
jgi:hypothetical protein